MASDATQPAIVIGLTGSFGSGCSYVAEKVFGPRGYKFVSLSNALKSMFKARRDKEPNSVPRHELQDFGDSTRKKEGADRFARMITEEIDKEMESQKLWVVDSIRNPAEVQHLREKYQLHFFLFGVNADREVRWNPVSKKYDGNMRTFDQDDKNDSGEDNPSHGQRVADCFYEADVVLSNNKNFAAEGNEDFKSFNGRFGKYIDLVATPLTRKQPITEEEALMAMAFAASQRSSCLKRKVGAVIVDGIGNVISSGFNEVPMYEKPCEAEYTSCYREKLRRDFPASLTNKGLVRKDKEAEFSEEFRRQFKILDCCRALHAEDNAILNLARNGRSVPLTECTIYTTTYPCRLCAGRIATLRFKRVVYLEAYPDLEAKVILKNENVKDDFFEGVTSRAYFRIYGEARK